MTKKKKKSKDSSKKKKDKATPSVEEKYYLYENSVQAPAEDIIFMNEKFKEIRGFKPKILREDFCGTGLFMCEWVKQGPKHSAFGLDLDMEPINYGKENHWAKLSGSQKKRVEYLNRNVLEASQREVDIVTALNFSYLIFKTREELYNYFRSVYLSLPEHGVFVVDLLGGPESETVMLEKTDCGKFEYHWDCQKSNPIKRDVFFSIHYKMKKGGPYYKNVFTYDWRLWSIPEIREMMTEVGFKNTICYWEEDGDDEDGSGIFYPEEDAENCDAWVIYIAGVK